MIKKPNPSTDQICRSLLQKAVRRGNLDLVRKVFFCLMQNEDSNWLRRRLPVIAFEECWVYGSKLTYLNDMSANLEHYLKLASAVKNKDAAGLGSLAYALSQGDESIFSNKIDDNISIKIVAAGIKRPIDFWLWIHKQADSKGVKEFVDRANGGFKKAGWPWDKAFAQAAAYLAVSGNIPDVQFSLHQPASDFPLWIGIDKHTPQGKIAIKRAAKEVNINYHVATWLSFYFESVVCNQMSNCLWWEREVRWRMKKINLSFEDGREIWSRLSPKVQENLKEDVEELFHRIQTAKEVFGDSVSVSQKIMF